jgi:hypothetical protein
LKIAAPIAAKSASRNTDFVTGTSLYEPFAEIFDRPRFAAAKHPHGRRDRSRST